VVVDAHPKNFIGVKLHQTPFLTVLDKYMCIVCTVQKTTVYEGPFPLIFNHFNHNKNEDNK